MEKHTKHDLDDICSKISCAVETVGAVHDAMESGGLIAESYLDALHGAYMYLFALKGELQHLVDELYEQGREAAEKEAQA